MTKKACKCPLCCGIAYDGIIKMLQKNAPGKKHSDANVFYLTAVKDRDLTFPEFKRALRLLEKDKIINREEGQIWLTDKGNRHLSVIGSASNF